MELYFPKFVLEHEEELSAGLKNAGVKDVFEFEKANFSKMMKVPTKNMAITSIMQTTKIQVRMDCPIFTQNQKLIIYILSYGEGGVTTDLLIRRTTYTELLLATKN